MKGINTTILAALNEVLGENETTKEKPPFKGEKPSGELSYESDITFEGKKFKLRVDTNVNPSKKGIKIQFTPVSINEAEIEQKPNSTSSRQIDYTLSLQKKLNDALRSKNFEVDVDPDVPNKNTIAFLIRLDWFEKIIRNIFSNDVPTEEETNTNP